MTEWQREGAALLPKGKRPRDPREITRRLRSAVRAGMMAAQLREAGRDGDALYWERMVRDWVRWAEYA